MIKRKPEDIEKFRETYNKTFPKKPVSFEEAEVIMDNLIRLYWIVRTKKPYPDHLFYPDKYNKPYPIKKEGPDAKSGAPS